MLLPAKVKYRKMQKGRRPASFRVATSKVELSFGTYGLRALTGAWVTSRQIEATRRAMTRFIKRGGKIWIRIFPDKPMTNHGNESVMGGGKGAVDHYVAPVRPGTVLFEMDGVTEETAREAMRLAAYKLPMRTRFIKK
ncbi:MAG TPA: 50S ribosomal protein L16 [Candidatus Eisenbacteria bacterium]|jgi:large subunit ribosomal protein L16|nr:50S ribosomal protein L16 [Candidatus Eisenbacteria bacterium]